MKKLLVVILMVMNICLFSETFQGIVTKVYDGDSIHVLVHGAEILKIRFYGIDAPELDQEFGKTSRDFLKIYLLTETVTIENMGLDRYGRTLGIIFFGGECINWKMIDRGFAHVYKQYCQEPWEDIWVEAERIARLEKKGLWYQDVIIFPWDWRKKK